MNVDDRIIDSSFVKVAGLLVIIALALMLLPSTTPSSAAPGRHCKNVKAKPDSSPVRVVNISCRRARRIVRYATRHYQTAPRKWVFINPGGCEGMIVRKRDKNWVIRHTYRPRPGRPFIYTVIYSGCHS